MEETTVSIIGIFIAAILMFIIPLILISERADDISQLVVQTATAEFVDNIVKSGEITEEKYTKFISSLVTSGNTYDIDIELKVLDENTAKLYIEDGSKRDTNTYYSIFTSQIEEKLGNQGKIILKQGDSISVTVKNSSLTLSQSLKAFYYGTKRTNIQIIAGTASGIVAINGAT